MGSHVWVEQCPYCGFDEMIVSSLSSYYFEVTCQVCGYARWTEERVPDKRDIELAKRTLSEMGTKEKRKAMDLYAEDSVPLITRLKGKFLDKD